MKVYRSKVDLWLVIVLTISSISLLTLIYNTFDFKSSYEDVIFLVLFVFLAILIWLPIPTTYYVVECGILKVHSIFLKWEIPLNAIQKIEQTSDFLSAPALSLDRIKIEYKKNNMHEYIMISPKNRAEFIKEIS